MAAPGSATIDVSDRYYPMQAFVNTHMDVILPAWWIVFWGLLAFMVGRFFVYEIYRDRHHKREDKDVISNYLSAYPSRRNWFFINEIYGDIALRLFGGAVLLGFLFTFSGWQMNKATTLQGVEEHLSVCWPFFQECTGLIFLETLPHGYSQTIVFMGLFAVIFMAVYALFARRIILAHACIGILFAAKLYFTLINYGYNANYDYYHTTFTIIYLFMPYKRFFGSLSVAFLYFLSTATKIHPGWLMGTYFSTLQTGLPIFPDVTIPVWTWLVIFMEMVGCWLLFSRNKVLQRTTVFFFATFHVYSGILVGYFYPTIVMPTLLIFFGPLFKPFKFVPVNSKAFIGWIFIGLLVLLQIWSHLIPGDEKYTMEGNFYGLYMFEANHQCDVAVGSDMGIAYEVTTRNARSRCDIYEYWYRFTHQFCNEEPPKKYSFRIDHSINGGPFYEVVNESDLCALKYKAFAKNEWIQDSQYAQITGIGDLKNFYR